MFLTPISPKERKLASSSYNDFNSNHYILKIGDFSLSCEGQEYKYNFKRGKNEQHQNGFPIAHSAIEVISDYYDKNCCSNNTNNDAKCQNSETSDSFYRYEPSNFSDIWSFSVTFWEFFTRCQQIHTSPQAYLQLLNAGYRLVRPEWLPRPIYLLMIRCWQPDPLQRPNADQLYKAINSLMYVPGTYGMHNLAITKCVPSVSAIHDSIYKNKEIPNPKTAKFSDADEITSASENLIQNMQNVKVKSYTPIEHLLQSQIILEKSHITPKSAYEKMCRDPALQPCYNKTLADRIYDFSHLYFIIDEQNEERPFLTTYKCFKISNTNKKKVAGSQVSSRITRTTVYTDEESVATYDSFLEERTKLYLAGKTRMWTRDDSNIYSNTIKQPWRSELEYFLAALSYKIGLGNLWSFPYLCYKYQGMTFIIPYVVCLFIVGIPLGVLEACLGQFSGHTAISVWKVAPVFEGVGWSQVIYLIINSTYYNTYIGYLIYYLFLSASSHLLKEWHATDEYLPYDLQSQVCKDYLNNITNKSVHDSACTKQVKCARNYFLTYILNDSGSMWSGLDKINYNLMLFVAFSWFIVWCGIRKGTLSIGKCSYITAIFPMFCIFMFLIRLYRW